jgi:hypothetical protein
MKKIDYINRTITMLDSIKVLLSFSTVNCRAHLDLNEDSEILHIDDLRDYYKWVKSIYEKEYKTASIFFKQQSHEFWSTIKNFETYDLPEWKMLQDELKPMRKRLGAKARPVLSFKSKYEKAMQKAKK